MKKANIALWGKSVVQVKSSSKASSVVTVLVPSKTWGHSTGDKVRVENSLLRPGGQKSTLSKLASAESSNQKSAEIQARIADKLKERSSQMKAAGEFREARRLELLSKDHKSASKSHEKKASIIGRASEQARDELGRWT